MKTNLDKIFKTDANLEKNGVWFEVTDGVEFLVRPFNVANPRVASAMAAYHKPYARQIEMGTLDPKKSKDITINLFCDSCLADWKGIVIDGVETKYSKESAVKLFGSLPQLFDTLWKYANDFTSYKEDLGNSSSSTSSGASGGAKN